MWWQLLVLPTPPLALTRANVMAMPKLPPWIRSAVDRREFLSARSPGDHQDFVRAGAPPWVAGPLGTAGRFLALVHWGPPAGSWPWSTGDRRSVLGPGPLGTAGRSSALVHWGPPESSLGPLALVHWGPPAGPRAWS